MTAEKECYRCVHCGSTTGALFRRYGPSVLKLNKCDACGHHVDKYVEYDPVIVAIDLILVSKQAQRHVIYNTEFKSYWKIFVVLTLLETYGVWHSNSLMNIAIEAMCDMCNTSLSEYSTHLLQMIPGNQTVHCMIWTEQARVDDNDMFIWEKNFYIHFMSVLMGVTASIISVYCFMRISSAVWPKNNAVPLESMVKSFTLAYVSVVFTVPVLVWGAAGPEGGPHSYHLHHALAFLYGVLVFFSTFSVLYSCPATLIACALVLGHSAKYLVTFLARPTLHQIIT